MSLLIILAVFKLLGLDELMLNAIDGISFNIPSIAAATVPEYNIFFPTLAPLLIPETIKSGFFLKFYLNQFLHSRLEYH